MSKENLAILILAAGTSSRLGEPKQLVKFEDKTLLEDACIKALKLNQDVFVVLGAKYEECKNKIQKLDVNIIENKNYQEGLSTSIKEGILNLSSYEKVLIMLCDQPFINTSHLQELIEKSKTTNKIVCSYYKNNVAVPAVFPKEYYFDLLDLKGDKGAKALIKNNAYEVVVLDDNLTFDVDTQEDKITLHKNFS